MSGDKLKDENQDSDEEEFVDAQEDCDRTSDSQIVTEEYEFLTENEEWGGIFDLESDIFKESAAHCSNNVSGSGCDEVSLGSAKKSYAIDFNEGTFEATHLIQDCSSNRPRTRNDSGNVTEDEVFEDAEDDVDTGGSKMDNDLEKTFDEYVSFKGGTEDEACMAAGGSRMDKALEQAFDTYLSFKGGTVLMKDDINKTFRSRMVHLGNVKYDLSLINLNQHMDILRQQSMMENAEVVSNELKIISREEWNACPPMDILPPLKRPVPLVIVCHTAGLMGFTQSENAHIIERIQDLHMNSREFDDIGYNWLIGMDGLVYEGRGWHSQGAHTKGYNALSLGVAFVGRFTRFIPTAAAMQAFHNLVTKGVELGHLAPDYKLHAARQLVHTESPGQPFYDVIVGWPHWAPAK